MLLSLHLPWMMRARVGDEGAPNGGEVMFFIRKVSRILRDVKRDGFGFLIVWIFLEHKGDVRVFA